MKLRNFFYSKIKKYCILGLAIFIFILLIQTAFLSSNTFNILEFLGFQAKENTTHIALAVKLNERSDSSTKTLANSEKNHKTQNQLEPASSQIALQNAIETIRMEAEGAFGVVKIKKLEDVNNNYRYQYLTTLSAMNYVQSRLSPYVYSYLIQTHPQEIPSNTETALVAGAGICGNQVQAFIDILRMLGLKARPVEFYYKTLDGKRASHIAAEVFYNKKWNYIDVTFGSFFRKPNTEVYNLLSIDEILKIDDFRHYIITNNANIVFQNYLAVGLNPLEYLEAKIKNIVVDGIGTISPDSIQQKGVNQYILNDLPLHFGTYIASSGDLGNLKYSLNQVNKYQKELLINIKAKACSLGKIKLSTQYNNQIVDISKVEAGQVKFNITSLVKSESPILLEAIPNNKEQPCYLTFDTIEIR
ncbi:MAG: hypothetical protein Fur006_00900 [Coleofasciculaceae cyanobacterium]